MIGQLLRGLALSVAAAIAAFTLDPAPAAAVTQVNACGNLTKAGETYVLTADISSGPDTACFRVLADRITLDLAGHTITGPGTGGPGTTSVGIWDQNATRTSTVVKNGSVTNFGGAIVLNFHSRSTIRGVTTSDNGIGILIGPTSLVKDCTVQRNLSLGIGALDGGQVEGCLIGGDADNGNGQYGLLGGQRMLVTRNTVIGNGFSGIVVGGSSTVTRNTVSNNVLNGIVAGERSLVTYNAADENGQDGIVVGEGSTVSYNTAADNEEDGIEATCPSTITRNEVGPSGADNIHPIGDGCLIKNNLVNLGP